MTPPVRYLLFTTNLISPAHFTDLSETIEGSKVAANDELERLHDPFHGNSTVGVTLWQTPTLPESAQRGDSLYGHPILMSRSIIYTDTRASERNFYYKQFIIEAALQRGWKDPTEEEEEED